MTIQGGCLCGAIRFKISGKMFEASNCHCSMCRKQSGSAFLSMGGVKTKNLEWLLGDDFIGRFNSSTGVTRLFCKQCGSTLAGTWPRWPDITWIALGTLDDDPGIKASLNIFVESKAPWFEITDALPQHGEL